MDINYCSKDGNINVNRTINKGDYKDKDNNTNSSVANNQKK